MRTVLEWPVILGPLVAILAFGALMTAAWWWRSRGRRHRWWFERTVVCPRDGCNAGIRGLARVHREEYLVTSTPGVEETVVSCDRFPEGPVTCSQECLR